MYTPSHRGSKRVAAAVRRYRQEHQTILSLSELIEEIKSDVTVIPNSEEDTATVDDVLDGRAKRRIRYRGKFASLDTVRQEIQEINGELHKPRQIRANCRRTVIRLLGVEEGDKLLLEQRSTVVVS